MTASGPTLNVAPWFHKQGLLTRNPVRYFKELQNDFGDFVRIRGLFNGYFLNHPDLVSAMLMSKSFDRSTKIHARMGNVARTGLVVGDGQKWLKQRRLLAPLFTAAAVRGFGDTMIEVATAWVDRWNEKSKTGEAFDLQSEMNALTLELSARYLFQTDVRAERDELQQGFSVLKEYLEKIPYPIIDDWWFPNSLNRRAKRAIELFDRYTTLLIERRRAVVMSQRDLISQMMSVKDPETGATVTDEEIRHEMLTFFIAGYETTASGLLWTFYHLASNPNVEAELHRELDSLLEGRTLTIDDYPKLPYTRRVIDEVQRLSPSTWFFGRTAVEDIELAGTRIAKGSLCAISSPALHRNESIWPNATQFDPDRFLPEAASQRSADAYIPFGRGPHTCIGKHFALQELALVTATLAREFRVEIAQDAFDPEDVNAGVSMSPRHGMKVRLQKRTKGNASPFS